jgi:hypothetical protein
MRQQNSAAEFAGVQEKIPTEGNCVESIISTREKTRNRNGNFSFFEDRKLSRSLPNGTLEKNDSIVSSA